MVFKAKARGHFGESVEEKGTSRSDDEAKKATYFLKFAHYNVLTSVVFRQMGFHSLQAVASYGQLSIRTRLACSAPRMLLNKTSYSYITSILQLYCSYITAV